MARRSAMLVLMLSACAMARTPLPSAVRPARVEYSIFAVVLSVRFRSYLPDRPVRLEPLTVDLTGDRLEYVAGPPPAELPAEFSVAFADFQRVSRERAFLSADPHFPTQVTVGPTPASTNYQDRPCVVAELSRVGFSADSTHAVVYLGADCGYDSGYGQLYLLVRDPKLGWTVRHSINLWSI